MDLTGEKGGLYFKKGMGTQKISRSCGLQPREEPLVTMPGKGPKSDHVCGWNREGREKDLIEQLGAAAKIAGREGSSACG